MHDSVAEVLQLSELEVDREKVRCRSQRDTLVGDKHFFDVVKSCIHFQEIVDHIFRLLKVSVDHRYLRIDQYVKGVKAELTQTRLIWSNVDTTL
jgi:hypothetical protein